MAEAPSAQTGTEGAFLVPRSLSEYVTKQPPYFHRGGLCSRFW